MGILRGSLGGILGGSVSFPNARTDMGILQEALHGTAKGAFRGISRAFSKGSRLDPNWIRGSRLYLVWIRRSGLDPDSTRIRLGS